MSLITFTDKGLYCPQADVYIDPWRPVRRAIITHAHADHSRFGMQYYLAHAHSVPVMLHRLGDIKVQALQYKEQLVINGVKVSLYPAGHIPGSAQVRLEYKGEVWVASGDYKLGDDGVCTPFEPVKCHHFITESTFGLPAYRWKPQAEIMHAIHSWWADNAAQNMCSVLSTYALGKAQRILAHLPSGLGPVYVHGAIAQTNEALASVGYHYPEVHRLDGAISKDLLRKALVLAPPAALGSPWMNKLKPCKVAAASGWMSLRGARRRRNVDMGFVLSDHADWDGLNEAVASSGANSVYVTHGYSAVFSRWLATQGYQAEVVSTAYEGELADLATADAQSDGGAP